MSSMLVRGGQVLNVAAGDLSAISTWPVSYVTAHAATILRDMLHRGFTTVRDAAGAHFGLARRSAKDCGPDRGSRSAARH